MIDRLIILIILLSIAVAAAGQPVVQKQKPVVQKQQPADITLRDFRYHASVEDESLFEPFRRKPGLAFLGSALIPGTGQAINKKWLRAGAFFLAEAALLTLHFTQLHEARKQQRQYRRFADDHWSVVGYARWLVNYHDNNNIANAHIDDLRSQIQGMSAAYDPDIDWKRVDLQLLREVEENTPFIYPDGTVSHNFSHLMPDYGSQQYYELISKYYQYGPGWRDFGTNREGETLDSLYRLNWDGSDMPYNFFRGAGLAQSFNDHFRFAGNMVSLLILNHVVSAFDAFLTVKINNNRLKAEAKLLRPNSFTLKYHF